ncbi:MAG: Asp-tRNA(Asn)/Glu-tRNA(Gln) amidotransferase subunit GatA, partial [Gemmatimonadetes bacterium]|nr:Asp-tRNA(Asn)/Glu-tRNA(Gln) amidotransferase subunit GatA [Gemmatimonadota bacterium]
MTTAYEAAQLAAARIEAAESSGLNATIAFDPEVLLRQGREVDARTTPSRLGVGGLPLAVKDNICTVEYDTTCGSRILENYRSPYEATAVSR